LYSAYLLYGPPGTGKTSLVSALAAKFGNVDLRRESDRIQRSDAQDSDEEENLICPIFDT